MTQSILNTLLNTPSPTSPLSPTSKQQAQNAGEAAQSFGNVLSRELNGRAAPPTRPATQGPGNNTEAANSKARQQQQHLGERQQSNVAAKQGSTAEAPVAKGAPAAKQPTETTRDSKSRSVADQDKEAVELPTAASAELLALVGSLMPKAAATQDGASDDSAATTVTADASASLDTLAKIGVAGAADGASPAATDADNAALEAMLAQAAQSVQSAQSSQTAQGTQPLQIGRSTQDIAGVATGEPRASRSGTENGQINFTNLLAQASEDASAAMTNLDVASEAFAADAAAATDPTVQAAVPGAAALASAALSATGVAPGEKLSPFVGTSAWDQALGQKVVWMAAGAQQSASLTLNPPDLGPLQVVINVHNAQAEASFTASQPEVRQALEAALPRLKEMLAEAGISLGQASVNAGSQNQQGNNGQYAGSAERARGGKAMGVEAVDTTPVVRGTREIGGNGLVNTFA